MPEWKKTAKKWAIDKFDRVVYEHYGETRGQGEFLEFEGYIGGDWLTFRYYEDGKITER